MPKKPHTKTTHIEGSVLAFNASPHGDVEGVVVKTADGTVQVNFPKHEGGELARGMKVGGVVTLEAELETEDFDHPVYLARDPSADRRGEITRLNYARHGEVNGVHLKDGTFVHLKPDGAKKLRAQVGDWIEASGVLRHGEACVVLESRSARRIERPRSDRRASAR